MWYVLCGRGYFFLSGLNTPTSSGVAVFHSFLPLIEWASWLTKPCVQWYGMKFIYNCAAFIASLTCWKKFVCSPVKTFNVVVRDLCQVLWLLMSWYHSHGSALFAVSDESEETMAERDAAAAEPGDEPMETSVAAPQPGKKRKRKKRRKSPEEAASDPQPEKKRKSAAESKSPLESKAATPVSPETTSTPQVIDVLIVCTSCHFFRWFLWISLGLCEQQQLLELSPFSSLNMRMCAFSWHRFCAQTY